MKRIIVSVLAVLILLSSLPFGTVSNATVTTGEIQNSLEYYKQNVFRDGTFWCGGNTLATLSSSGCNSKYNCTCNTFAGASQCHGFALCLSNCIFGSYPAGTLSSYYHGKQSNGWTCYTKSALGTSGLCSVGLQSGDIIRAATNSSYTDGHTAVCWKVEGDTAYFAECWGSSYCKIKWGGFNFRFYSLYQICANYSYVALWRNDSVIFNSQIGCAHSYIQKYETTHPHAGYMECTKCGDRYYNNTSTTISYCLCCQGVHSYTQYFEDVHPHAEVKMCTLCGHCVYTGRYTTGYGCPYCCVPPQNISVKVSNRSFAIGESIAFSLQSQNTESATLEIYRDGVLYNTLDATNQEALTFSPIETGTYYAKYICKNQYGTALPKTSESFTVLATLDKILTNEDFIFCLYKNALSENSIRSFCLFRNVDLALYGENNEIIDSLIESYGNEKFAVEDFDSSVTYVGKGSNYTGFVTELCRLKTSKVTSSLGAHTYILYPFSLPYDEAQRVAAALNTPLASITSDEENALVASLIKKAGLSGAFIGATDSETEGIWKWSDGSEFTYTDWNLSYTGFANKTSNYLYMYKDGTWIDSPLTPESSSGFICEIYTPFEYTDLNGDAVAITEYLDEMSVCTVPEKYEGKPITEIKKSAFKGRDISEITIPKTVTAIDEDAFDDCTDLLIRCYLGSYAYKFAKAHNFKYKIILPFEDVKEGSWYADAVSYCYETSLMNGVSDNAFSPNSKITRAMFVTVLSKIDGADTSQYKGISSFTDVASDKWYAEYIEWAFRNGYASGYGETFKPDAPLTREQLAVFLYAYSEKNGYDVLARADLSVYNDGINTSIWAYNALAWACDEGLITGTSSTTISPLATATRAQNAVIVKNYIEKFVK